MWHARLCATLPINQSYSAITNHGLCQFIRTKLLNVQKSFEPHCDFGTIYPFWTDHTHFSNWNQTIFQQMTLWVHRWNRSQAPKPDLILRFSVRKTLVKTVNSSTWDPFSTFSMMKAVQLQSISKKIKIDVTHFLTWKSKFLENS